MSAALNSLRGKVVAITGASSGIGANAAVHMARLGAKLVLSGRNEANLNKVVDECKACGTEAIGVVGDLGSETGAKNLVDKCMSSFKKMDVLVNNAGIAYPSNLLGGSLEMVEKHMDVNVKAVYRVTSMAAPHLIESQGAIVNISTCLTKRGTNMFLAYSMSKAALDQFTTSIAVELAEKQVRVNGIHLGIVDTPIHARDGKMPEDMKNQILEQQAAGVPLKRLAQPQDVAETIAFLASDQSAYITGSFVTVDGGMTA